MSPKAIHRKYSDLNLPLRFGVLVHDYNQNCLNICFFGMHCIASHYHAIASLNQRLK